MAHTIESRTSIPADRLRDALDKAERLAVIVEPDTVEELLVLMDRIQQLLVDLAEEQIDLRPEEVRWQNLLNRITSKPGPIVRAAAKAGGFSRLREKHPPAEGVWWHLDRLIAERRRRSASRTAVTLLIIVGVVAGVYWAVNTFFPPDPAAVLMVDTTASVDQYVREGKWVQALAIIDRTLEQLPEEPELWIWKTVLLEQLGDMQSAAKAQSKAQQLMVADPVQFWIALGNIRYQVGDIAGTEQAAEEAIALDPDEPQAYFLLGGVAEARNDIATAAEMFNKTYELAEKTNNPQLAVIAKVRLGQVLQRPQLPAPPLTQTPGPTQSP